ncbi:MAG: hypothetical protein U5L04_10095 [Trueperaceae bacterium]|nr:hypothetical protein [Trueperaceae bacterium]
MSRSDTTPSPDPTSKDPTRDTNDLPRRPDIHLVRRMWRAASLPQPYFDRLADVQTMRLTPALVALLLSFVGAALWCSVSFMLATGSAFVPVVVFATGVALLLMLFWWGLGGLALQRPGELDTRAWEIAAWSWSPLFFTSLALLPVVLLVSVSTLPAALLTLLPPLGLLGALAWHLQVLRAAVRPFIPARATRIVVIYAVLLFGLPMGLLVFVAVALSNL